jgi:hypothetical protein
MAQGYTGYTGRNADQSEPSNNASDWLTSFLREMRELADEHARRRQETEARLRREAMLRPEE